MNSQKELEFKKYTVDELKERESIPTFNECNHYVVDMTHLRSTGIKGDWMNTIVINLPNENHLTLCVMQVSNKQTCIDASFHGENIEEQRVLPMGERDGFDAKNYPNHNRNIYALIADAKTIIN